MLGLVMPVDFPMLYTATEGEKEGTNTGSGCTHPLQQQRYQTCVSRLGFSIDLLENPIFFTRLFPSSLNSLLDSSSWPRSRFKIYSTRCPR